MTSPLDLAIRYARDHREASLDELKTLIRIPSVSTLPEHKADVERAAQWLADRLRSLGLEPVAVMPTAKHPMVYGEWLKAGPGKPTILVYGHYDVQPVDPLDQWRSDPFEPQIRGEELFARGASDMKGQLMAYLAAVQAIQSAGPFPHNLKVILEGEEEIGSPSLPTFVKGHKDLLRCDLCLNTDSGIQAPDIPAITYALRGLCYFEIRVRGTPTDLHSGQFGGVVDNPALVLCQVLAAMKDRTGHITLPGFYDQVRRLSREERADLARLPQTEEWWRQQSGAPALFGEPGFTATERATARPTLDVNGFLSGFTGEGSKTVLPAKAMAKVSMRLVPDQTTDQVRSSLGAFLEEHMPPTVSWELDEIASSGPAIVERDSPAVSAASNALEAVWGKRPLFVRQGGSIPIVILIQEQLGAQSLLLGFGLPDDNLHAPNEKLHLPTFYRGIETFIRFTYAIAGQG